MPKKSCLISYSTWDIQYTIFQVVNGHVKPDQEQEAAAETDETLDELKMELNEDIEPFPPDFVQVFKCYLDTLVDLVYS